MATVQRYHWSERNRSDNYKLVKFTIATPSLTSTCDIPPDIILQRRNVLKTLTAIALVLALVSSTSFAAPTVTGNTISWPQDGWYQVQRMGTYETICGGTASCEVEDGNYVVINHTTGERFPDILVGTPDIPENNPPTTPSGDIIEVSGNTISWPDNGWYQVQNAQTYDSICSGTASCDVEPGTYVVINHSTGERFDNIVVGVINNPTIGAIEVSGNTISWPDDGWYQVQTTDTFESLCSGGSSCEVADGIYTVINHTTGERFSNIRVPEGEGAAPTDDDDDDNEPPVADNVPPVDDDNDEDTAAARNLALITRNATRNTQFDDNPFRNIPARDISVSDLTSNNDIYNEALLDTTNSGYFRVKCEVSHFAYDDPIVYPNQPGRAHLHMFFGNTEANAYSTFDSLLNTGTGTCNGEDLNRTAYWVPAMLDSEGNALIPDQIMVYYKNDNFRLNGANELVSPFPDNLRMIAGNGAAISPQTGYTGAWQAQPTISFSCGPAYNSNDRRQALIPDCYGSQNRLEMQIAFPQCVNEAAGTYQSDQSHMSYSENGYYGARCPASHSTDISSIMYRIFFRPEDNGGALTNLHLSSDVKMDHTLPGGTTAHADWFGAWHPDAMDMWVDNCNNTQADCETGLLSRNPAISLVLRKRGFYPRGYRAPAAELVKLCPGKDYNPADPLRSVAMCRMN